MMHEDLQELQENMANEGLLDDSYSEPGEGNVKKKKNLGNALKGAGKKMFGGLIKKLSKKKNKKDKEI